MKRFILALFSVVALLALVAPSPVNALRHAERETNAERLARGLPPNPPTRRGTAPQRRASLTPGQYIEVRDMNGNILGFVTNGGSSHGISVSNTLNFPVTFNPTAMTINDGAHYLGGHDSPVVILGPNLPTAVYLQKVSINDAQSESNIWTLGAGGELFATWTNPGAVKTPALFVLNGDSIQMTGDPAGTGLPQVELFLVNV